MLRASTIASHRAKRSSARKPRLPIDFYGPQKIYELLEKHDSNHRSYFVAGPWNHGQWGGDGHRLGALDFGSDASAYYRDRSFQPWFDYWLRDLGS